MSYDIAIKITIEIEIRSMGNGNYQFSPNKSHRYIQIQNIK